MLEQLDHWIHTVGPAGIAVLAVAALIESVFPPFPGDTILLLGGVYAVRGEQNWVLVLLAITFGSALGSMIQYAIGAGLTRRVEQEPNGKWLGIPHASLHAQMERLRRRYVWLVLLNRFMPGIRGVIFLAAGASRLPFAKAIALGAASALAWNLLVLGVGILVGGNAEALATVFRQYQVVALGILAVIVVALAVRYLARKKSVAE